MELKARTQMESNTTNPTVKSDVQPTNYSFGSQLPIKASIQMGSNYTNLPMKSYGQPNGYNFADQFRLMKRGEAEAHNQNQNPDVRAISESNIQFTFDLFKVLGEEPGNLFFSPLSIHVILSLLYLGAVGNTAEELRHGLRLPDDDRVVKDGVNATMEQLKAARDVILDVANKIYLMIGSAILDSFNAAAVKFMASVDQVDFGAGEAVRKIINTWVEEKTHERIKDLIPVGALNSATTLVLVNAVYFKGDWIKKFDKKDTKKMPFYSTSTEEVEMMYVRSTFKYAYRHELNSQVLLLPYKGNRLNMIIFLPSQVNGLLELETKLSGANFHDLMTRMYGNDVYVYLPKFKMEYSKKLNDAVQKLGMKSMFGDRTMGLTGITGDPMKVSQIMHKSFIEVNEEGTEAAAATAVICCQLTSTSSKPPPIVFKADHPFLFFIVDSQTTAILFAGRFATVC